MTEHFRILEVDDNVSLEDLKIAFRKKAKLLHPDLNRSSTAQNDFVQLHRSYEYILKYKFNSSYNDKSGKFFTESKRFNDSNMFDEAKSFRRAERYSKLKYKEYLQSNFYKDYKAVEDVASLVEIAIYISFIFILPIFLCFYMGPGALFLSPFIAILTAEYWRPLFSQKLPSKANIKRGISIVFKSLTFKVLVSVVFFGTIWLTIGFQTFISVLEIIGYSIICYLTVAKLKFKAIFSMNTYSHILTVCITLWIISSLLFLNYFLSYNELTEKYSFILNYDRGRHGQLKISSLIELENSQYRFYPSVRFFWDYEEISRRNKIAYTTRNGLFFYKVYTERSFE